MISRSRFEPFSLVLLLLVTMLLVAPATAQDDKLGEMGELGEEAGRNALEPPDTSSPRATLSSFLEDAREAWTIFLTSENESQRERYSRASRRVMRAVRCLDLSEIPPAAQRDVGSEATILILDVLERIRLPPWVQIPDFAEVEKRGITQWTIPHTNIVLERVSEGPRAGEFLFTPRTVERAREFYDRTRHLEPRAKAVVDDGYSIFRTLPGWMIPLSTVRKFPEWVRAEVLGQALWQWFGLAMLFVAALVPTLLVRRWARRAPADDSLGFYLRRIAAPVTFLLLAWPLQSIGTEQIGLIGTSGTTVDLGLRAVMYAVGAWLAIRAGGVVAEFVARSPRIQPRSVDAHLIRIAARLVSIVISVLIAVEGARSLGVPVMGLLAGVGVGGLAVALAAQSTIENFIGSLTLFLDHPVRVGDFCRFGEQVGTVEQIGLRSSRIRTLGRSVVTVPNAEFSRLRLDNLTERDANLFRTKVALRYETTPEQLRDVLRRVKALLLAHPRVLEEPARVRLVDFGSYAFQIEIFAYIDAPDWGEFLGIREELYLQVADAVEAAGTRLAVPARTAYLARDPVGESLEEVTRPLGPDGRGS